MDVPGKESQAATESLDHVMLGAGSRHGAMLLGVSEVLPPILNCVSVASWNTIWEKKFSQDPTSRVGEEIEIHWARASLTTAEVSASLHGLYFPLWNKNFLLLLNDILHLIGCKP